MSSTTRSDSSAGSATIALPGDASPISRVARNPPPPGIWTSTIATSGRLSAARAIASSVSPAVPTTSKRSPSCATRTARTSGSSSAMSTRGTAGPRGAALRLRQQRVDALDDERGRLVRGEPGQLVLLRVAREHERRRHPGVDAHADVGGEAVADHEAVGGRDVEAAQCRDEHRGVRLADVRPARRAGARLDRGGHGRAVGLAAAAGEGAEAVRVRGDERRAAMEPDRVERDLELAIVEGAVVARDDDVDLGRVLRGPDAGLRERPPERLLGDREYDRLGMVVEQPAR